MTKMESYAFDGSKLDPRIAKHLINTAVFDYKDMPYEYGIIDPKAAPQVPNFVGMPGGQNLFASQEIPKILLPHFLAHEIECCRIQFDAVGRCAEIEKSILMSVPRPVAQPLLLARFHLFQALMSAFNIDPNKPKNPLESEIAGTMKYLHELAQQTGNLAEQTDSLTKPRKKKRS